MPPSSVLHSRSRLATAQMMVVACPSRSDSTDDGGMGGATATTTTTATLDSLLEARDHGTLGAFLSSAESIRQLILPEELPYAAIRKEINRQ